MNLAAEDIRTDRRLMAVRYVVSCLQQTYEGHLIDMGDVGRLVDTVDLAIDRDEFPSAMVHGSRLLSAREAMELAAVLQGRMQLP